MVDMSPAAVTERLRLMGELWELSVKSMNSKVVLKYSSLTKKERALLVEGAIKKILVFDWDPIGISEPGKLNDEYDAYIARIYRILVGTRSEDDIVKRLRQFERDAMGLPGTDEARLRSAARKLLELDVR